MSKASVGDYAVVLLCHCMAVGCYSSVVVCQIPNRSEILLAESTMHVNSNGTVKFYKTIRTLCVRFIQHTMPFMWRDSQTNRTQSKEKFSQSPSLCHTPCFLFEFQLVNYKYIM